jgi:hypothetical protein
LTFFGCGSTFAYRYSLSCSAQRRVYSIAAAPSVPHLECGIFGSAAFFGLRVGGASKDGPMSDNKIAPFLFWLGFLALGFLTSLDGHKSSPRKGPPVTEAEAGSPAKYE